ncbi:hypothetical protein [Helicobacter cetorum]|uniref:hypothetical protein n=1 Tax=Helicobacter cetorum TaxID=138563 RepID=UPI000CF10E16|nr:hypothetical protein [Helicobacter cetorum]
MKNLTLFTNTKLKALFVGASLSMLLNLSLHAEESSQKNTENTKHKNMSPVTHIAAMTKCDNIKEFNSKQKEVLRFAYQFGSKENLGYELASIAWKESCAGTYRVNFSDPSAGIYHAYIPSVLKSYGHKDSPFLRNVMGELLIQNNTFASEVALKELIYWKTRYNGDLKNMIKSYNKGSRWERNQKSNEDAEKYYEDIQDKIKHLKESKLFNEHAKKDQALQKSANSNLALDPIGNTMPQLLASVNKKQVAPQIAPIESKTQEIQAIKEVKAKETQEIKEIKTSYKEFENKEHKRPMTHAHMAKNTHTKTKSTHKPKVSPRFAKTHTKKQPHEVCKRCTKGQRNAILANRIAIMQEP